MTRNPMCIENDRLVIRSLKKEDLKSLEALRCDHRVYRYEPTFLTELQGTPEEALETLQNMDLYEDRQCILGVYEKTAPSVLAGLAEFYDFKPSGKVISLGYRLFSKFWGKGMPSWIIAGITTGSSLLPSKKHLIGGFRKAVEKWIFSTWYPTELLRYHTWRMPV